MQNLGKILLFALFVYSSLYAAKDDFKFQMFTNKTKAYVGEPVKITFKFRYKINLHIAEANFSPPTFHDFWTKPGKKVPTAIKNGYSTYTLDYIVSAQKPGHLDIEPARMDIGILRQKQKDMMTFERVKYTSIFSNALTMDISPLPKGVTLFGNYTMQGSVDKTSINANEPVNYTLKITGSGNIEDISDFKIHIKDAVVYADKAKHNIHFEHGQSKGEMTQKFAIVSDKNFTIPDLSLIYFDNKSKTKKEIHTSSVKIEVINTQAQNDPVILEKRYNTHHHESPSKITTPLIWLMVIGAFLFGMGATWLLQKGLFFPSRHKTNSIEQNIIKTKSDKDLLALLLPYAGKTKKLDETIKYLEENLYEHKNHPVNRKVLAKNFATYVTIRKDDINILS